MSRFIIACGGTGGHLAPGIAVAERLIERGHDCCLVVSRKKIDRRLLEDYPEIRFEALAAAPFDLRPDRLLHFFGQTFRGLLESLRLLRSYRAEAVIGFGGFTTAGMGLAAALSGRPLLLHEANRPAGRTTRMLARLAKAVYLPEGMSLRGVPLSKTRHAGFPVRREMRRLPQDLARHRLGLDSRGKLLVVLGGSQGARALNDWVRENAARLASEGINVVCLTGMEQGTEGVFEHQSGTGERALIHFMPFCGQMAALLSAADLVVSRAGAGTLAEMTQCATPAILVPYPHAADDHQRFNALFLERCGACVVVEQRELHHLFGEVTGLIFNDWLLNRFRENLRSLAHADAAEKIASDLEDAVRAGSSRWKGLTRKSVG